MSVLPPVFVEFIGNAGGFKKAIGEVEAGVASVERSGAGPLAKFGKMATTVMNVAGVATAAFGVEAIKMAGNYQSGLTLLQTAGGESAKNMKLVSDGIMNLATKTGTSTQQLLEGAYIAEKAMYRGADMLNVLKAATEGAVGEHVDEATAVNALTSVMQSYGAKASQAVSIENELVKASGLSKTTFQEFSDSLSNVVPLASQLHVSFAQIAGAEATLTQHGTSAQESTQELNNLLRNLSGANGVAVNAMNQLGLSSVKVAQTLSDGPHGLQNALNMVVDAIQRHLGPSGLVVVNTFKQSASATQDLQSMLAKMPAPLEKISEQFLDGHLSMAAYRKDFRGMGGEGYALGSQFMTLVTKAKGFNDLVKAGNPQAQTFVQYLKQMLGGASGLNTALMLTGNSASYFTNATNQIAAAGKNAGKDIEVWGLTQKNFNVQLDQAKQAFEVLAIKIGQKLIPIAEKAAQWFTKHIGLVKDLAYAIGVLAAGSVVVWAGTIVTNLAKGGYAILKWALTPLRSLVTQTLETSRTMAAQSAAIAASQEEEASATETASARMIRAIEANKAAMAEQGLAAQGAAEKTVLADEEMAAANTGAAASGSRLAGMFKGIGAAGGGVFAGIIAGAMGEKYAFDQATQAGNNLHSSWVRWTNFASNFVIPGFGVLTDKLGLFGKNIDGAKVSADQLLTALVNNKGAADDISRSWLQAQLQAQGLDVVAAKNGMTLNQLTQTIMRGGSAVGDLENKWLRSKSIGYQQVNTLTNITLAYRKATAQVLDLSQRMKLIPTTIHSEITVGVSQALWNMQLLGNAYDNLVNHVSGQINISAGLNGRQGTAFAGGGWVNGPGSSTSDSVPAWLSNGEYVLSADMLSGRQRIDPGVLSALGGGGGSVTVVNYTTNVQGSVISERELLDVMQSQGYQYGARNVGTWRGFNR